MSGPIDDLSIIQKFLSVLTWKKIIQLIAFFAVIVIVWSAYDNRERIYSTIYGPMIPYTPLNHHLSKHVTDQIDSAVGRSELIVGIQITFVDFQRNVRVVAYSNIDNPQLKELYNKFSINSISDVPLFNEDEKNNRRLVELINGEFVCYPFKDTLAGKLVPEAERHISVLCANGIPPRYSKFTGIVSIYLSREPTIEELDQVRTLSKMLGTEVYDHDLK